MAHTERLKCYSMYYMKYVLIQLFLFSFISLNTAVPVNKSELESANKTCSPKDTCVSDRRNRFGISLDWKSRNCFCDDLCAQYGDCCIDANAYNPEEQISAKDNFMCVQLRNYQGIYMKSTCTPEWEDDEIKEKCLLSTSHSVLTRSDPMLYMPVTNKESRITYSNFYCSVCNNESSNIEIWKPRIECPSLTEFSRNNELSKNFISNNLIFKEDKWGININLDGESVFHSCYIDPFLPETVADMVRPCIKTIDTCADDWTDIEVKNQCSSYTGVVYENEQPFKNNHCATCNYAKVEFLYCEKHSLSRFNIKNEFNPTAFSLLFDFTDSSGSNIVGISTQCSASEVWDPFFKKCRNVICGKNGQEYRHGRCIDIVNNDATPPPSSNVSSITTIEKVTTQKSTTESPVSITSTESVKDEYIEIVFPEEPSDIKNENNFSEDEADSPATNQPTQTEPSIDITTQIFEDSEKETIEDLQDSFENKKEQKPSTLNCNRILLPDDEFTKGPNGTIIVQKYSRTFLPNEYELHEGGILVCTTLAEEEKFSNIMGYVTLAGLGISCICIMIHLIAFMFVPDLRNLSGRNLCSLCICLLFAYGSFILGVFGEAGKLECFVLAAVMYYFFLASFCWMNVMAFDIWYTLRLATSELRVSSGGQWRKCIIYSIYGWLLPAVAIVTLIVLDLVKPENISENYLPEFGERWCWFGQRKALLVFFAAPLSIIMGINIIMFIMTARIIASTTNSTAKMSTSAPHQNQFKLYMRLALLMGLTWISGIVAGYLQLEIIWYIFVLLNTLQGLFIFVAFTCTRKVFRTFGGSCWRRIKVARHTSTAWAGRSSSSSRKGLESQDSNHSHLSHSSMAHLTTNTSRSNVDSF